MAQMLLLNGPNLNLLGTREPGIYGRITLAQIEAELSRAAADLGHQLDTFQSNAEAELVEKVQQAAGHCDFLLINPGAFTHTSVALRDAILGVGLPFIEIHISNIHAREEFRRHSYFSDIAEGVIAGLGPQGYLLALQAADRLLEDRQP
ncbi:MAG: type II 3-dehydroquinate dehydratase [Gammaproteobacteria bacterium]|nr:MAG: type II 3-dehydroquinate dehydratase [Gammaproteobacteria bacterium]